MHQLLSVVMMCHRLDLRVLPCGFLLCLHLFTDLVAQEHLQHGFTLPSDWLRVVSWRLV